MDTGPVCDSPTTQGRALDSSFPGVGVGLMNQLFWPSADAELELRTYTPTGTLPVDGAVDFTYDGVNAVKLRRICGAEFVDWSCGETTDCWEATSGTVHVSGVLAEPDDPSSDQGCCGGILDVELQSIVFDNDARIDDLQSTVHYSNNIDG